MGYASLFENIVGNNNTVHGTFAGYSSTGSTNVFIGYRAGLHETGNNTLYIDNTDTTTPLVYGNFSTDELTINGKIILKGIATAFSNISSENSPITVTDSDYSFDCNATDSDVTFNLMSSSTVIGQGFEFTTTSSNKCFLNAIGAETINGFGNYSGLDVQGESVLIRSNGTNWTIKASY